MDEEKGGEEMRKRDWGRKRKERRRKKGRIEERM